MKRKLLLAVLLTILVVCLLVVAACGTEEKGEQYAVYQLYADEARADGQTPLTYEQWLLSIRGDDGKDGKDGADGADGKDGKSAYDIWLENGNEGTEEDFLAWLKGQDGTNGISIDKIEKTDSDGLVDTYTIYFSNNATTTFTVTNGEVGSTGKDGKSAYEIWQDCGYEGSEEDFLAWLKLNHTGEHDHQWTLFYTLEEANCLHCGYIVYSCSVCNMAKTSVIPIGAHNYVDTVTPPTCTEQGYTSHICSVCSDTIIDTYVDELGHDYEVTDVKRSCMNYGYTEHLCKICGYKYFDNMSQPIGYHNFADGICTVCGANINDPQAVLNFNNSNMATLGEQISNPIFSGDVGYASITWECNGIKVTNSMAESATTCNLHVSPARFYKSQTLEISYTSAFKAIRLTLDDSSRGKYLVGFDNMSVEGATIVRAGNIVLISFTKPVEKFLSAPLSAQTRIFTVEIFTDRIPELDTTEAQTLEVTIEQALAAGKALYAGASSKDFYKVTGVLGAIENAIYGNSTLIDATDNTIKLTVFGMYDSTGEVRYDAMGSQAPKTGDTVTLIGKIKNYQGTIEIVDAKIVVVKIPGASTTISVNGGPQTIIPVNSFNEREYSFIGQSLAKGDKVTITLNGEIFDEYIGGNFDGVAEETGYYDFYISDNGIYVTAAYRKIYCYIDPSWNWDGFYVYSWSKADNTQTTTWPGAKAEAVQGHEGWFLAKVRVAHNMIIMHDNTNTLGLPHKSDELNLDVSALIVYMGYGGRIPAPDWAE